MQPIVIEIVPVPKPRMVNSDRWKKRRVTDRYWEFKDELCAQVHITPGTESDPLSLTFILPMPLSWSKKKRNELDGQPHMQRPDLSNLIKAVEDSLFIEDSLIHTYGPMKKIWGRTGAIIIN